MGLSFVFVVLAWAGAASSAHYNGSSGVNPRAFAISFNDAEPLDFDELFPDVQKSNTSRPQQVLSEDTVLFLTGPLSTRLMPSWYLLVCVLSVPVNLIAVLAFARRIRPKKPAAIYMLNLACADLLFTLLLPFRVSYHFLGNDWVFGAALCRVVTAAFYWNMYCSVLLVCCISVDRLLAVVYPIHSLSWRRPQNAVLACGTMWVLSFVGSVPLLLSEQTMFLEALNITTCHDVQPLEELQGNLRLYFLTICCALFFLPFLITMVSYSRVIWTLTRVPLGVRGSARKKTRAVVMAATVLVIFVLCFMPTNCVLLVHYLMLEEDTVQVHTRDTDRSYALYLLFLCLGSLNCVLDPMVYYFGSSQCQKQLSGVLRCEGSSSSYKSSQRTVLKSSRTESSRLTPSSETESCQNQYKKLLL